MTRRLVLARQLTPRVMRARLHSRTLAGRLGKLRWAHKIGQVTDEEYRDRKRLLDLLDGFGWWLP